MPQIDSIETIVSHGLCIGCGICESLAGTDTLEMGVSSYGQMRPQVKQTLDADLMADIRQICPGVSVTGPSQTQIRDKGVMDTVWGPIRTLHRGWMTNEKRRYYAAAGGALTGLGIHLLESGKVDAVLHVRASTVDPMLTDAQVSTTPEEVVSGAQSRYGPAAPLVHVHRLLDEGRRFAVIGKPCDMAAIRNLAQIDDRVDTLIPYCLTIFCGGLPTLHTARKIAKYYGVESDEVEVFRFRGNGWPGPTHVKAKDGRVFERTYEGTWYDHSTPWKYDIQFRCKICPDAIGELGDVACPDGWVMRDGKPIHEEAPGVNILVARTARGEELVREAAEAGVMALAPFDYSELDPMHGDHFPRKLENTARLAAIKLAGHPAPRFTNFRFWGSLRKAGLARLIRGFLGTWRRVRAGANQEPLR